MKKKDIKESRSGSEVKSEMVKREKQINSRQKCVKQKHTKRESKAVKRQKKSKKAEINKG